MPSDTVLDRVYRNFAHDDAEQDTALDTCFVPPSYFAELKLLGSPVIVGRFGSGKTALARRLAKESGIPAQDRTEIYFKIDPLSAELQSAKGDKDFPTLARALVYLRFIYDYAEKTHGTLINPQYAALTKELKSLKLLPYADLISRVVGSVTSFVGRIQSIDVGGVFGVEMHDPAPDPGEPTVRRYRQLILKIEPVVQRLLNERPHLLLVDSVDPTRSLLGETAELIGALIRWLQDPGAAWAKTFRSFICVPHPVFKAFAKEGIHVPAEQIFKELWWAEDELAEIILQRVSSVVGKNAEQWLEDTVGIYLDKALPYTFGRPRDCIKLVRSCLAAKISVPTKTANECWLRGIEDYSRAVLQFMGVEWHLKADGWDDIRAVLSKLDDPVDEEALTVAIDGVRNSPILKERAVAGIIDDFESLGLVRSTGHKTFEIHPTLRQASTPFGFRAKREPGRNRRKSATGAK